MKFPWQHDTETDNLPQEVQDYYQAEKRQRVGVASLLAVGTLILTVVLAAGLFFGGRWTWRHVIHKEKTKGQTTATVKAPDDATSSSTSAAANNKATDHATTTTPGNTQATTGSAATTGTAVATGTTTMPNTGPSNIIPVILGTIAVSIAFAELYQRRAVRS